MFREKWISHSWAHREYRETGGDDREAGWIRYSIFLEIFPHSVILRIILPIYERTVSHQCYHQLFFPLTTISLGKEWDTTAWSIRSYPCCEIKHYYQYWILCLSPLYISPSSLHRLYPPRISSPEYRSHTPLEPHDPHAPTRCLSGVPWHLNRVLQYPLHEAHILE